MTNDTGQLVQVAIPGVGEPILAKLIDGKPFVALRPMCESIAIDADAQLRRLKRRSWATTAMTTVVAADGKQRDMTMIDRRTMTMWLATIDENRVAESARPIVRAFQAEAADALDAYFHEGGAVNPSATVDQLDALVARATAQAKLIATFQGIIDPKHLEAKARIVLARALGETPELDPASVPLYVSDYLKSKGLASDMVTAKAPGFGKRLKGLYIAEHGTAPAMAYQELPNKTVREVCAYTQADLPLFDQVWMRHYEGVTRAVGGAA